jgi:hypothetical protein
MKLLIIAVLLSVMQSQPPVPRQTPDNPTRTAKKIKAQSKPNQAPSLPSPSTAETNSNGPTEGESSQETQKNTEHSVVISKLPAVTVATPKRDLADWGTWGFNFLLVVVGGLQVLLLCWTLRVIRRQAKEMIRQRILMRKQAAEMEKQTRHLEGSVAAAQTSAEAAKLSADIAARVSIPTLVIEKFEPADAGAANLAAMLQYPNVKIVIKNYGQTPALLKFWNIVFTCEELPAEPQYWNQKGSGIMLERDVIEPNQPYTIPPINSWRRAELSLDDVQAIINHKKKLWAYGFICYDDIFRSARWRMKFCEFALNVREGWIQWEGGFSPPIYQGTEEFPWGLAQSEGQKAENPNEPK